MRTKHKISHEIAATLAGIASTRNGAASLRKLMDADPDFPLELLEFFDTPERYDDMYGDGAWEALVDGGIYAKNR